MGWWGPQSRTKGGCGVPWRERARDLGPGLVGSTWPVIAAFLDLGFSTWRFKGDDEDKECVKHADRCRLLWLSWLESLCVSGVLIFIKSLPV